MIVSVAPGFNSVPITKTVVASLTPAASSVAPVVNPGQSAPAQTTFKATTANSTTTGFTTLPVSTAKVTLSTSAPTNIFTTPSGAKVDAVTGQLIAPPPASFTASSKQPTQQPKPTTITVISNGQVTTTVVAGNSVTTGFVSVQPSPKPVQTASTNVTSNSATTPSGTKADAANSGSTSSSAPMKGSTPQAAGSTDNSHISSVQTPSSAGGASSGLQTKLSAQSSNGKPTEPLSAPLRPAEVTTSERALITKVVFANEGGTYRLARAPGSESGYSVGRAQIDLASRPDQAQQLITALKATGNFSPKDITTITQAFSSKGESRNLDLPLSTKVNSFLSSPDGRAIVAKWDSAQMSDTYTYVRGIIAAAHKNPLYGKDQAFTLFVDSGLFKAYLADNHNQFGNQFRTLFTDQAKNQKIDFNSLLQAEAGSAWVAKKGNGGDLAMRRGILVNFSEQSGEIDANRAASMRTLIKQNVGVAPPQANVFDRP